MLTVLNAGSSMKCKRPMPTGLDRFFTLDLHRCTINNVVIRHMKPHYVTPVLICGDAEIFADV